jgi:5-bromo-4-chloroindolyl phosphate hydrolysis protein
MTDALPIPAWIQLLGVILAFLAPTMAIYMSARITATAARKAAAAVEQVAIKLDESNRKTEKKLNDIHFLVDGNLSEAKAQITRLENRLFNEVDNPAAELMREKKKDDQEGADETRAHS